MFHTFNARPMRLMTNRFYNPTDEYELCRRGSARTLSITTEFPNLGEYIFSSKIFQNHYTEQKAKKNTKPKGTVRSTPQNKMWSCWDEKSHGGWGGGLVHDGAEQSHPQVPQTLLLCFWGFGILVALVSFCFSVLLFCFWEGCNGFGRLLIKMLVFP